MKKELTLSKRTQDLILYRFEHPKSTLKDIALAFNISIPRVSQILNSERVLQAYPLLARRKQRSLVPEALERRSELMNQNDNLGVAEKISSQILSQAGVLDPVPTVVIHELKLKTTEELQAIIDEGKKIQSPVIDAEIVE